MRLDTAWNRDVDSLDFGLEFTSAESRLASVTRRIKAATDMSFLYLGIFLFSFLPKEKAELLCCCIMFSFFAFWAGSNLFLIGTVLNAFGSSSSLSSDLNIAFEMRPHPNDLKS